VQSGGRIGEWITGTIGAVAATAALREARRSGCGAHVDLAMFDSMVLTMNTYAWLLGSLTGDDGEDLRRTVELPSIEPTADGYVGFCTVAAQQFQDFLVLIDAQEWCGDRELASRVTRWERRDEFIARVHDYTTRRTTADVIDEAAALRIPVSPIGDGSSVPKLEALEGRASFVPNPAGFVQPAVPYRLHGIEPPEPRHGPSLGAHQREVAARRVERDTPRLARDRPLAGVRVLDLTAWWAGPMAANVLALLGADVVKVESAQRPDGMRFSTFKTPADADWWEWGSTFHGVNTNKRGITADLRTPDGLGIVHRLIERSDVLIENFTPRVMEAFGLDWEQVSRINPRIVMTRMPAFGLTGAWRDRPGFAQTMEQASGMAHLTGYRDEPMQIPRGPCDPLAGLHAVFATLLALDERDRSGCGRLVEVTMIEAALNAAAEQTLEHSAYGALLQRDGNRGPTAAPQGLYPCLGDDRWIALAVETDEQWVAFRRVLGEPDWARDPAMDDRVGRRAAHDLLDDGIARWTSSRHEQEAVSLLVDAGVPAAVVGADRTVHNNPSLVARGFFEEMSHPVVGTHPLPTLPFRYIDDETRRIHRAAPTLGQHNREVLRELGYDDAEIESLARRKVIGSSLLSG
jgi:crotonobetainyl-CoA:carnitine CoA-transferase CaiB-like acyl-CoA transferase